MSVTRSEPGRRMPPGARRAALLEMLRDRPDGASVADLAEAAGLHPNTVRAHLDALVRTGRATRRTDSRGTPGRPREVYEPTFAPDDDRNYRLLAEMLATRLADLSPDPASAAVEAGREWSLRAGDPRRAADGVVADPAGPDPAPGSRGGTTPAGAQLRERIAPVMRVLNATGFAPELAPDGSSIHLHHCPFLELAVEHPDVVCGAHLGLIRGTLERIGSDVSATRIVPFARPGLCLAELDTSPTAAAGDLVAPVAPHEVDAQPVQ